MSTAFPAQDGPRRIAPVVSRTDEVPASLSDVEEEDLMWQVQHQKHVQNVQEHKLHHIHILDETTGERMPLTHCRRVDNPKLCKGDFPRTKWLIDKPVVLCHGLLKRMGMPASGRRNKLCSLHGPMNHESLNGTHPALMAVSGDNSDVQLPYRLPLCAETH